MEFVVRAVVIGVGATIVMDLWMVVLRRCGVPSLKLAFLGRWIGHLPRGRWAHRSIAATAPVPGESWIGWCAHYAIGITFSMLLLWTNGVTWARSPSIRPALLVGMVTVAAPLLILQPALGAGIASRKTPTPVFNSVKSLVSHTVFGIGLYLAALVSAALLRFD
jgi:hypothetical protein